MNAVFNGNIGVPFGMNDQCHVLAVFVQFR